MQPIVDIFGGIDIYKLGYVSKIPEITETKRFSGNKLFTDEITIECKNFNNLFSVDNIKSLFSGMKWQYKSCKIWDSNSFLRWDGVIRNIKLNHNNKTMQIISANIFARYLNTNVEYESTDWETPAMAFKNICDEFGFTYYDEPSINSSHGEYVANGCYIKCNFNKGDDMTLQQAIEKIGEISGADIFGHNNLLYFQVYKQNPIGAGVVISDSDMSSMPVIEFLESDIVNDYNIKYVGCNDTAVKDTELGVYSRLNKNNGLHDMAEIDGQQGNQIEIKDISSARFIGNQAIRKSHKDLSGTEPRPLLKMSCSVGEKFNKYIDITTTFKINFSDENWAEKVFEPIEVVIDSDNNKIKVSAVEVDV